MNQSPRFLFRFLASLIACLPLGMIHAADAPAAQPGSAAEADSALSRCLNAVLTPLANETTTWCDVAIDTLSNEPDRGGRENVELAAAYHNRAVLLLRASRFELVEADLTQALRLQPQMPAVFLTRGNLRLAQTRFSEALADINQAITLSNGSQPAFFINRALALKGLGEISAAEQDMLESRAVGSVSPSGSPSVSPSDRDVQPGAGFL